FAQRFASAMLLPDNKTLKDVLNKEAWKKLQKYVASSQFPLDQTERFNAAMVGILMMLAEAKKMGVGEGVDEHYDRLSRANNKFGGGLENEDDVLSYMQALNREDPNKIILSSLDDINSFKREFEKLIAQWKVGDLDALDKNLGEQMRKQMPLGYTALLVNRNNKWLPQIKAMLATSEIELVMVGSLHLSGRDGLLAMLNKDGYEVTAYKIP
ncbi:MAG: TraB/GumN family protein, partial [Moraxellaceae bacterium]